MVHITTLASDAFEGRGPGTPGETRTVNYLVEQFKLAGLQPGNPDGTTACARGCPGAPKTPGGC